MGSERPIARIAQTAISWQTTNTLRGTSSGDIGAHSPMLGVLLLWVLLDP